MQHLPARPRPRTASSSKQWARTNELSSAYAALAAELTKTEIRSIGGYSLGRVIGEGTFGKVRLGVHRLTGTRVAIKQVPKSLPSYSPNDPSSPLSLLTREIHHHRRLRHPHVLSLYELIATESSIYLVTELCSGGELFDYLVESSNPTPGTGGLAPAEARRVFGQLVLGVAYLHAEGVVHRDLKLENVLLDEHVNVKIADLGFGREFEKGRWMDTRVGTLGYTAPEVLTGQRYLGEPVDIWALGVILYALLTGALPFDDDDEGVMRALILDCRYTLPTWLDPDARALVNAILAKDPLRRPSLREILAHPFFTRVPGPSSGSSSSSSAGSPTFSPPSQQQQAEARLAPPILAGSSGTPASPLGAAIHPVSLQTPPSPRAGAESSSYFPAPGAAPLSANRAGKQRAVPSLDDDAASPPPPPPSSHPPLARTLSSASTSSSPAPSLSALPPHLSTAAASPIPAAAAVPGPMSLRRHPSTASIDFGPSAPGPALMQRAHSGHGHGGGSVASLPGLAAMKEAAGGGGGGVKRRKSVGAASVRSVRSVRRSLVPEDFEAGAEMGPGGGGGGGVGEVVMEEETESEEEGDEDEDEDEDERDAEGGGEPVDAPPPDPPVDYLSLLASSTSASSALLSSESDRALLALLDQLGFDRGQVEHSVRTSACDSCAAVWWMLRRKREEREPPPPAAAAAVEESAVHEAAADEQDVTATAAEPAGEQHPQPNRRPRTASAASTSSGGAQYARAPTPPPLTSAAAPLPQTPPRRPAATSAAAVAAPTSPVSPSTPLNPADAEARLSYFLQQNSSASQSVPVLSYFPTIDSPGASPSKNRPTTGGSLARSKSRDQLAAPPPPPPQLGSPSLAAPGSPSTSSSATDEAGATTTATTTTGVGKRGRAGSVSMLARATSVIGQSLASLGSSNGSTPSEEGGSSALFGPRKGSLPSEDAKQGAPGTPSAGGTPPLPALQSSVSAPPTPQVAAPTAVGEVAPQAAPATPPSTGSRTITLPPIQTSSVPAAEAPSQQSAASQSTLRSTAASRSARPLSVVSTASSTGNNGSAAGGSKKGLKGANLLSTFKLWFGQDPRKRKRASLGFGAPGAGPAVPSAAGGGAGIGRSQSMYVGSPLRRPPMGSRRSSNTSAQGQMTGGAGGGGGGAASVSRRSSVSSARGAEYSPVSGSALGMTPSRLGYHHHRRASDSSRTSMSERAGWGGYMAAADGGGGGGSRPTSLRSFSGQPGSARPGSARGRYRHSKAASSSSASSFVGTKDAVYRRPPTTTTVRRSRHGSHGRRSSDGGAARHAHSPTSVMGASGGGGRHHRRTRSGASSAHRSSSSSQGGGTGADSDFFDDDELAEGEEAILEEIEEDEAAADVSGEGLEKDADASTAKLAAWDKALRALSGDSALAASLSTAPPSAAAVPRPALLARHSSSRAGSTRSSSPASSLRQYGAHRATTFTAHKTTHLFGSPLQPRALPSSFPRTSAAAAATATSRAAPPPRAPSQPLRDVFSLKSPKDESVPTLAAPHGRGGDHDAASTPGEWVDEDDDVLAGYGGGLGQGVVPHAQAQGQADELELGAAGGAKAEMGDSPIAERVWGAAAAAQGVGVSKFEGRYAGLGAAGAAGGAGGGHGKWARPAVVVEEEEEEEEE
ncbi:hypothetical protein Rhopal_007601-T1 [Rhodotorula paludigena]|uniref:Protein kinase domain-containing protein n=1 Tax=Rhodotorula paludigena TaxID=86838 RepID=A0AAV5GWB1_9BASI|nr:hypothetical protein Rhopal_007601-T1 [Rhodotorula paludigena]